MWITFVLYYVAVVGRFLLRIMYVAIVKVKGLTIRFKIIHFSLEMFKKILPR